MKASSKRAALLKLAKQRQSDRLPGHRWLAYFHRGYYECDHVSPWSISACNVDADLMLLGQDWASSDILDEPKNGDRKRLGQDWSAKTNVNLREFLGPLGIEFGETYATNLFPFVKIGAKNGKIAREDLLYCAQTYAVPMIEIVAPKMAICLGQATFEAVRKALGLPRIEWREAQSPNRHTVLGSTEIYGLPHPGPQGTVNAGDKAAVSLLWQRLGRRLERL